MLSYLGYVLILIMGFVLGLTGGGGSILTLPILKYSLGLDTETSIFYSLFLVGLTSLFSTIFYSFKKQVDFQAGITFALPAIVAIFLIRRLIWPILPSSFTLAGFSFNLDSLILLLFISIILYSSYKMISSKTSKNSISDTPQEEISKSKINLTNPSLILKSFAVGMLTGLVGAGGGFIITPTLVLIFGLEMKKAVATSLFIVSLNSLVGFSSSNIGLKIDWNLLFILALIAIIGSFVGVYLQKYIPNKKLKIGFGYFILITGLFMFVQEFLY